MSGHPIEEIERITKANRKIGLGVMGFARMLFKLAIPYDSERGIETAKAVVSFIRETGCDESAKRGMCGCRRPFRNSPIRPSPRPSICLIAHAREVKNAYFLAFRLGCKGINAYRGGARRDRVMNIGRDPKPLPERMKRGSLTKSRSSRKSFRISF